MQDMGWLLCWFVYYVLLVSGEVAAASKGFKIPQLYSLLCTVFAAVVVPTVAYLRIGRPKGVALGLMVDFFWWGGLGGTTIAGLMNTFSIAALWPSLSPGCAIATANDPALSCQVTQIFMWILTPGLWEEIFKGGWVLWRIKTKPWWSELAQDNCVERRHTTSVPRNICGCFPTRCCTCWWRLVETPEAVFLCAIASGAGFEAIENIQYMVNPMKMVMDFAARGTESEEDIHQAVVQIMVANTFRALMFVHILWTGFVGLRLSQYFFAPPESKPTLFLGVFAPVMVLHGLWDWVAFDTLILGPFMKWSTLLILLIVSIYICFGAVQKGVLRENVRASVVDVEVRGREVELSAAGNQVAAV